MSKDIRWRQRLENYKNALKSLSEVIDLANESPLSKPEQQGLINGFEYAYRLAWHLMKNYFEWQGGKSENTGKQICNAISFSEWTHHKWQNLA